MLAYAAARYSKKTGRLGSLNPTNRSRPHQAGRVSRPSSLGRIAWRS